MELGISFPDLMPLSLQPLSSNFIDQAEKAKSSFDERHGTKFTEEDFLRFEQFNKEILNEDMTETLRNNPPDVVYSDLSDAFSQGVSACFNATQKKRVLSCRMRKRVKGPFVTFLAEHFEKYKRMRRADKKQKLSGAFFFSVFRIRVTVVCMFGR